MSGRRRGGGSLRMGIDNEVYTIAIRLLESNEDLEPTVPNLWQAIQRSNSSLKRKPKRLIEDSLERVLASLADDGEDEEAVIEEQHARILPEENLMNKSLTSQWKSASATAASSEVTSISTNGTKPEQGQRRKRKRDDGSAEKTARMEPPKNIRFEDLGGIGKIVKQLKKMVLLPLRMPQVYTELRLPIPRGILLHGPPGCGKTQLAKACAAEARVPLVEIQGPSVVSGMSGESEKQVRELFEEAKRQAPCILFIDEIDVIAPKRESSQSQMEKRIVAQLLISMDALETEIAEDQERKPVIVLAATNRPDTLDTALRRGGRFDTEINMGVPNEGTRAAILRALTKHTPLADDIDFSRLARMTPGFVGADIRDLVGKAGAKALDEFESALENQSLQLSEAHKGAHSMDVDGATDSISPYSAPDADIESWRLLLATCENHDLPRPPGFERLQLTMDCFLSVLPTIVPSSKREGFATIPDTTWANIGALKSVREELQLSIVDAIRHPERYAALGLSAPAGILLWGPPGCGKTLLAKAVANESKANFISVKGPELLNKFVGESERAVRTVFSRAQSSVPCVIFFDELDALVPRRSGSDAGSSEASARVVNTLLTEMDGLGDSREGIYVIAATNRPDVVDEAMLRPGRLETLLYVGLPGPAERAEILCTLVGTKRSAALANRARTGDSQVVVAAAAGQTMEEWPSDAELAALAQDESLCGGLSGADLAALVRQAGFKAMRRGGLVPSADDFARACEEIVPSVRDVKRYEMLRKRLG